MKSQSRDLKTSTKGHGYVAHFKNVWSPSHTSGTAEARVVKFYKLVGYIGMTNYNQNGCGQGHVTHFLNFGVPTLEARHFKYGIQLDRDEY